MITNSQSGTRIDEIAAGIYRINTPLALPGEVGFSFNQYLIVDDAPMLFHSGMRRLFPLVSEAIRAVLPLERLRYVGLSHFEADECGALNQFLAAAPNAQAALLSSPLCEPRQRVKFGHTGTCFQHDPTVLAWTSARELHVSVPPSERIVRREYEVRGVIVIYRPSYHPPVQRPRRGR